MFLAGDIGGTKTVLALYGWQDGVLVSHRETSVPSRDYPHFTDILDAFLAIETSTLRGAAFGVAGPVVNGCCVTTNLPWILDESALSARLLCPVKLLNDLAAAAVGMLHLPVEQSVFLSDARVEKDGMKAVIAAGTGLGEALLFWHASTYQVQPTEGGHTSFAPNNADEDALLVYLREKFAGHVSVERVLSGPGLYNIWCFLRDTKRGIMDASVCQQIEIAADPSAAIANHALADTDAICVHALTMFCRIYGAEAGNLALKSLSTSGVLVGGGIAPKILPFLQRGEFMQGFLDKGRFRALLTSIPVVVILEPRAPLIGAAHTATGLL
ncbi:MAG: glucokinase [Sulfuriferula sp.]|nr:glucokinase [Sulfuriferula sp.]